MQSYYRKQLEDYLAKLDINADKVLDIGGSQNPVINRLNNPKINLYQIMDLAQPHISKETPDIVGDLNIQMDIREPEIFDVAFCLEVSEYWYDPVQAIKNIKKFLKKDGILYITFCYNYPLHPPIGEDMLRYTKNSVYKLLKGFEILEYIPRKLLNQNEYFNFLEFERYRYKSISLEDLIESGSIIKCRRIQ